MHKKEVKIVVKYYQRIKDLRNDNEKTQTDIAEILNTRRQQYARWENGEQQMPMDRFIILAKYYNVSLDYLAGLTDIPKTIDGKPYIVNPHKQGKDSP